MNATQYTALRGWIRWKRTRIHRRTRLGSQPMARRDGLVPLPPRVLSCRVHPAMKTCRSCDVAGPRCMHFVCRRGAPQHRHSLLRQHGPSSCSTAAVCTVMKSRPVGGSGSCWRNRRPRTCSDVYTTVGIWCRRGSMLPTAACHRLCRSSLRCPRIRNPTTLFGGHGVRPWWCRPFGVPAMSAVPIDSVRTGVSFMQGCCAQPGSGIRRSRIDCCSASGTSPILRRRRSC